MTALKVIFLRQTVTAYDGCKRPRIIYLRSPANFLEYRRICRPAFHRRHITTGHGTFTRGCD